MDDLSTGGERPSFAESLYGRDGPISGGPSDARTRAVIEAGQAKPSDSIFGAGEAKPGVDGKPPPASPQSKPPAAFIAFQAESTRHPKATQPIRP